MQYGCSVMACGGQNWLIMADVDWETAAISVAYSRGGVAINKVASFCPLAVASGDHI